MKVVFLLLVVSVAAAPSAIPGRYLDWNAAPHIQPPLNFDFELTPSNTALASTSLVVWDIDQFVVLGAKSVLLPDANYLIVDNVNYTFAQENAFLGPMKRTVPPTNLITYGAMDMLPIPSSTNILMIQFWKDANSKINLPEIAIMGFKVDQGIALTGVAFDLSTRVFDIPHLLCQTNGYLPINTTLSPLAKSVAAFAQEYVAISWVKCNTTYTSVAFNYEWQFVTASSNTNTTGFEFSQQNKTSTVFTLPYANPALVLSLTFALSVSNNASFAFGQQAFVLTYNGSDSSIRLAYTTVNVGFYSGQTISYNTATPVTIHASYENIEGILEAPTGTYIFVQPYEDIPGACFAVLPSLVYSASPSTTGPFSLYNYVYYGTESILFNLAYNVTAATAYYNTFNTMTTLQCAISVNVLSNAPVDNNNYGGPPEDNLQRSVLTYNFFDLPIFNVGAPSSINYLSTIPALPLTAGTVFSLANPFIAGWVPILDVNITKAPITNCTTNITPYALSQFNSLPNGLTPGVTIAALCSTCYANCTKYTNLTTIVASVTCDVCTNTTLPFELEGPCYTLVGGVCITTWGVFFGGNVSTFLDPSLACAKYSSSQLFAIQITVTTSTAGSFAFLYTSSNILSDFVNCATVTQAPFRPLRAVEATVVNTNVVTFGVPDYIVADYTTVPSLADALNAYYAPPSPTVPAGFAEYVAEEILHTVIPTPTPTPTQNATTTPQPPSPPYNEVGEDAAVAVGVAGGIFVLVIVIFLLVTSIRAAIPGAGGAITVSIPLDDVVVAEEGRQATGGTSGHMRETIKRRGARGSRLYRHITQKQKQ